MFKNKSAFFFVENRLKRAAIFSSLHLKTCKVQNGRPDGNRALQAPTDAPMRPLGTLSLIHDYKLR